MRRPDAGECLLSVAVRSMAEAAAPRSTGNSSAGRGRTRGRRPVSVRTSGAADGSRRRRIVRLTRGDVPMALFGIRYGAQTITTTPVLPFLANSNIIWLSQPGPGGGGGGGGNRMQAPPRHAEQPGN